MKIKTVNKKQKKKDKPGGRRGISIKYRLIITFMVFAILPLLTVNTLFYNMSNHVVEETSEQFANQLITQICTNVNYFLNEIEQRNLTAALDPRLNTVLDQYERATSVEQAASERELKQKIIGIEATGGDSVSNVFLLLNNQNFIGNLNHLTREELLGCYEMDPEDKGVWINGIGSDAKGLYYIRNINNTNRTTRGKLGVFVTRIKIDKLVNDTHKIELFEGASFYILDQDNKVIFTSGDTEGQIAEHILNVVNSEKLAGTSRVNGSMITYETAKNGWKVVFELPEKALTSKLEQTRGIVGILIIVALVLAIVFGTIVSQSFSKPIINMMKLIKAAEEGDMTGKIDEHRHDELGMLASSINKMIENIRKLIGETKQVMGETLENGNMLDDATKQSVETAEQLALSIQDIATGANHQAVDAEKSIRTMYDLSGSIQQVMQKTKAMVSENADAKEIIQTATKSVGELNETMLSSIEISHDIKLTITDLGRLTSSIEDIMKFIDRISEETNLLALNASIEAARAGEVGKGFAVVANEVRNLAEQSKRSTIDVRKTLNTIKAKTADAVKLVTDAHSSFLNQEEVVKSTHAAFDHIIHKLITIDGELLEVNQEVASMEELKNAMIEQIERMGTVTEETASTTEELNAFSEEQSAIMNKLFDISGKLTNSMNELSHTMNHFKVE